MQDLPTVLVLASGKGRRFTASGGRGSKLDALLGGRPVLEWTLQAVRASGLPWHLEDRGHEGMGDSIAAAVRAVPEAAGWLVLPGDLPMVRPESLRAVAAALQQHDVVVPTHEGVRGHPVGFARVCGAELAALQGPAGAAPVVRAHGAFLLELADPGVTLDIDTVDDLAAAQALFKGKGKGKGEAQG